MSGLRPNGWFCAWTTKGWMLKPSWAQSMLNVQPHWLRNLVITQTCFKHAACIDIHSALSFILPPTNVKHDVELIHEQATVLKRRKPCCYFLLSFGLISQVFNIWRMKRKRRVNVLLAINFVYFYSDDVFLADCQTLCFWQRCLLSK